MNGFTTMMYDIARKVVSPATSSVRTSESCASTSNRAASVSVSPIEQVWIPRDRVISLAERAREIYTNVREYGEKSRQYSE